MHNPENWIICKGVPRGFPAVSGNPVTHQLKHKEIEAKGLQNLESVMKQDTF